MQQQLLSSNELRHSINHPHGMIFESENALSPFGFVFGIRAGQEIDCEINGYCLSIDLIAEILHYLSIREIMNTRKISKFFNHAACIYLSKINDAFVNIGILSEFYVFSNFYKKCELENYDFGNSTKDGKIILLDFNIGCFDIGHDDLNDIELPSNCNDNNFVNQFISNCKLGPNSDENFEQKLDEKHGHCLRSKKLAGGTTSRRNTSDKSNKPFSLRTLSKKCMTNHVHLCFYCSSKYKQNICEHIYCPIEYHKNCTGNTKCEYNCVCLGEECDQFDKTVNFDKTDQNAKNEKDAKDPSGQQLPISEESHANLPKRIKSDNFAQNLYPTRELRGVACGSAFAVLGEFNGRQDQYDSDFALPLISVTNRDYFERLDKSVNSSPVNCDCGRKIYISFKENLSVKNLKNHLLLQNRILGKTIVNSCDSSKFEIIIPQIIQNYEANNKPFTWHDITVISNFIKSANNQVKLDYLQTQICNNYKQFKISSMDDIEFYYHPSIYSEELHPIQCLHEYGYCEESQNCGLSKLDAAIEFQV